MTCNILFLVSSLVLALPLITFETVVAETLQISATSLSVTISFPLINVLLIVKLEFIIALRWITVNMFFVKRWLVQKTAETKKQAENF